MHENKLPEDLQNYLNHSDSPTAKEWRSINGVRPTSRDGFGIIICVIAVIVMGISSLCWATFTFSLRAIMPDTVCFIECNNTLLPEVPLSLPNGDTNYEYCDRNIIHKQVIRFSNTESYVQGWLKNHGYKKTTFEDSDRNEHYIFVKGNSVVKILVDFGDSYQYNLNSYYGTTYYGFDRWRQIPIMKESDNIAFPRKEDLANLSSK